MKKTLALLAVLLALPLAAGAAQPLATHTPISASYEVRLNNLPFKADARQTLSALGNGRWRLELKVESFLLDTVEWAEFRWDGATCRTTPERYSYVRKGIGKNRKLDMRFDPATRQVTRTDLKSTSTFAFTEETEDRLSHTLALACRIARGARGTVGIDVAWDRDVRHFDYKVASSEENVKTPYGTFRALRMERLRADSDRVTTSWVAASAGWQSVQMQHTEGDGRLFQLRLLDIDNGAAR